MIQRFLNLFKGKHKKVGLVLGGGASRGAASLAIIQEIEKLDIKITHVSGTSVGAIIAAYYALYGEVDSLTKEVLSFSKKDWRSFSDFNKIPRLSLIKGNKFKAFLEEKFKHKTFADTKIPLVIAVTNLTKGTVKYIRQGSIVDAVLMSCSYPGIFPPIKINNDLFVDGGVIDNNPFKPLLQKKLKKIIVVDLFTKKTHKNITGIISILTNSIELMMENALGGAEKTTNQLFIIKPQCHTSIWNFSDIERKYNAGKTVFRLKKKELEEWLCK